MSMFGKKRGASLVPRRDDFFGPLETAIDRMVDDFFGNDFLEGFKGARFPKLNAYTHDGNWVVEAGVPGVKADDLSVEVMDGVLTLAGQMSQEGETREGDYCVRELSNKAFRRQIRLPDTVEGDPDATLKDGLLTLKWKVKEEVLEESKVKKIEVKQV